jgi:hypothetical protein
VEILNPDALAQSSQQVSHDAQLDTQTLGG